jgi:hypothetical protein
MINYKSYGGGALSIMVGIAALAFTLRGISVERLK